MRQLRPAQAECGHELVVAGEDRLGPVEHGDATRTEPAQLGHSGLDAVERLLDVEVGENEVAGDGPSRSLGRRRDDGLESHPPTGGGEGEPDGRLAPRDDEEPHPRDGARERRVGAGKIR